jgi:NAD(P)H dehydrogenase (quinone)
MNKRSNILITGASGKTGLVVIRSLSQAGFSVTAFIHKQEYSSLVELAGAQNVILGNLRSVDDLQNALQSIDGIYHICPNMASDELGIGRSIIAASRKASIKRFVYHSVLHPQIQSMSHHWQKLLVEEELLASGLPFTILQPTVYMQNLLGYKKEILNGIYSMPYPIETRLSYLDLSDLGDAVAQVFSRDELSGSILELCGTKPFTQRQIAQYLSDQMKITVRPGEYSLTEWEETAIKNTLPTYTRTTLRSMFEYYARYGLIGSPQVLTWLLGRSPISLPEFIAREF